MHFVDSHYEFDYPSDYKVVATAAGNDEWLGISPKSPPGGTSVGSGNIQNDPIHPDMLPDDELNSYQKTIMEQGKRVIGGARTLAVKKGTCKGLVEIDPNTCPPSPAFKPVAGNCYAASLMGFCKTPTGARMAYTADLGFVPDLDHLTPEAAAFGKTHERILSTLEFK